MSKKDRKSKKSNEPEVQAATLNSAQTTGESTSSDSAPQGETMETPTEQQESSGMDSEMSSEDLLEDVRRSLIEEDETDRTKKETKWWRRFGRKQKSPEPEPPPQLIEIDLPAASLQTDRVEEQNQATEPDGYAEQIDDLIDMLETEQEKSDAIKNSVAEAIEIPPEPEPEIDFDQLKEQAFRPRTSDEPESESNVRSIALEGGEEVFVEVEAPAADPFEERLQALENALRPYRTYIYMTFAFLGVAMAVTALLILFNAFKKSRVQPETEISNMPYPVAVSLPGGWSFDLGRGELQGGSWAPSGPEWLAGTEVCRWVSLPWSRQLEAVFRTLNPKDPIELVMSNNDKLVYGVYSIYEMAPQEIQKLDAGAPCLLLILTESNSEKRWVLTALP